MLRLLIFTHHCDCIISCLSGASSALRANRKVGAPLSRQTKVLIFILLTDLRELIRFRSSQAISSRLHKYTTNKYA